ncbi:MAG: glycogen/starch synthase [Salinivirgaceae bacterium]|jgi:starch synthase|nr:glycogen/starch synthase [Salinivirgaceae bacterium]
MEKKKVLFVSQEITPYLPESEIAKIGRELPQGIQERGKEIRTFMPKFGCINERRNQLHEVIRLSGMNLIIDDTDHPLIIKVASIQAARMQVYFIDNEEYFQRKFVLKDKNDAYYNDNDERAIFFARGVLETVQKLRWAPDIIHCHGWFTSLVPLYIKKSFKDNPLFSDAKMIYSIYNDDFSNELDNKLGKKLAYDGITNDDVSSIAHANYENLTKLAIENSDGLIMGSETINSNIKEFSNKSEKPILTYKNSEDYIDAYSAFYDDILS